MAKKTKDADAQATTKASREDKMVKVETYEKPKGSEEFERRVTPMTRKRLVKYLNMAPRFFPEGVKPNVRFSEVALIRKDGAVSKAIFYVDDAAQAEAATTFLTTLLGQSAPDVVSAITIRAKRNYVKRESRQALVSEVVTKIEALAAEPAETNRQTLAVELKQLLVKVNPQLTF